MTPQRPLGLGTHIFVLDADAATAKHSAPPNSYGQDEGSCGGKLPPPDQVMNHRLTDGDLGHLTLDRS
jgi:hypothetical protein